MRRRRMSYVKESWFILCIAGSLAIAAFTLWGPRGFVDMQKAQRELESRRARVEALRGTNQARVARIHALKTDKAALEAAARELGYVREGEIIQQLPEGTSPKKPK
jgi:cell division protein FtsB